VSSLSHSFSQDLHSRLASCLQQLALTDEERRQLEGGPRACIHEGTIASTSSTGRYPSPASPQSLTPCLCDSPPIWLAPLLAANSGAAAAAAAAMAVTGGGATEYVALLYTLHQHYQAVHNEKWRGSRVAADCEAIMSALIPKVYFSPWMD